MHRQFINNKTNLMLLQIQFHYDFSLCVCLLCVLRYVCCVCVCDCVLWCVLWRGGKKCVGWCVACGRGNSVWRVCDVACPWCGVSDVCG